MKYKKLRKISHKIGKIIALVQQMIKRKSIPLPNEEIWKSEITKINDRLEMLEHDQKVHNIIREEIREQFLLIISVIATLFTIFQVILILWPP